MLPAVTGKVCLRSCCCFKIFLVYTCRHAFVQFFGCNRSAEDEPIMCIIVIFHDIFYFIFYLATYTNSNLLLFYISSYGLFCYIITS